MISHGSRGRASVRLLFPVLLGLAHALGPAVADIISASNIQLDANGDGSSEATLSTQGRMGIGTTAPSTNLHVLGNAYLQSSNLGIGTSAPKSTLEIQGTLGMNFQTASANATLSGNSLVLADASTSSGNITLTLPYAGNVTGRSYTIKKITSSNTVWLDGGGNDIDNEPVMSLTSSTNYLPYVELMSNGSQWFVTDRSSDLAGVAASNLVLYYKFDESSGNVATDYSGVDSVGGGLNGGMTFSSNSTTGLSGKALTYDDTNDYVLAQQDLLSRFNAKSETISAWVNFSKPGVIVAELGQKAINTSSHLAVMGVSANASIWVGYWLGTTAYMNMGTSSANVWHHVVKRYDNLDGTGRLSGFVDGVKYSYPTTGNRSLLAAVYYALGAIDGTHGGDGTYFGGLIDEVKIFNKALSDDEVRMLYQAGP